MIQFELKLKAWKGMFLDTEKVRRAVDPVRREALSHAGAAVRMTARRSMGRDNRRTTSAPGQPPHAHSGDLKRWILYGYDWGNETVVVGPMRLNQKVGNAPEALEYGGPSVTVVGIRRDRRKRRVRIRARPYMRPALEAVQPRMEGFWAAARDKYGSNV